MLINSCVSLYADDTAIYYQANDPVEIGVMLQEDLELIHNWMKVNKLSLNVSKTKSMLFDYSRGASSVLSLSLDGNDIEHVSTYKYLGLLLDDKLSMELHISKLCSKTKMKLGMLGRIRTFISKSTAITLYKSLLLPVIEYGDLIYGIANATNLERLQKLQNSAMRIILLAPKTTHINAMLTELNFLNLSERRMFHLATLLFKCVNNMAPSYLCNLLEKVDDIHGRDTRASTRNDLVVQRSRIAVGDKAFQHRGPLCWNSIPSDIRISSTIVAFKNAYIDWFMSELDRI